MGLEVTDLPETGVDGADQDPEGLAGAAPHDPKNLTEKGDEAQPALDVRLLELLAPGEISL